MSIIVDGFKLWNAIDSNGVAHTIAAYNATHVIERGKRRGVEISEQSIGWHNMYRQYFNVRESQEQSQKIGRKLYDAIFDDVALNP